MTLAGEEHAAIVQAIRAGGPLKAARGEGALGIGSLYESGMELAFFERYAGDNQDASAVQNELERALPLVTTLPPEERRRIDAVNLQYGLLGKSIPDFEVKRSFQSRAARAQISRNFGAATIFVVFPDWCVQCRKMMKTMTTFGSMNETTPIHAYGLMFPDGVEGGGLHQDEFKELQGTSTLLVSPEVPVTVGATDYPLGIVVDRSGVVRFAGALPMDAFNGDGYVEKIVLRMVAIETAKRASGGR